MELRQEKLEGQNTNNTRDHMEVDMSTTPNSLPQYCSSNNTEVTFPKPGAQRETQSVKETPTPEKYVANSALTDKTSNIDVNMSIQTKRNIVQTRKTSLQGSIHQGDELFGSNAGFQCVPNCLAAASLNYLKSVNHWEPKDMDTILNTGNELYAFLQASSTVNNTYMLIHELPREIEIFNEALSFHYEESIATVVGLEGKQEYFQDFNMNTLYQSLQMSLTECDVCFVCFSGNTMLVGRRNGGFYIFDPHSRCTKGLIYGVGRSTCIFFDEIDAVYLHIQELAKSMDIAAMTECEVTGAKVCRSRKHNEGSDDVHIVSMTTECATFSPLTRDIQPSLCDLLSIPCHMQTSEYTYCKDAGTPGICFEIERDGNCFFRAVSYAISNTQSNHEKVRTSICNSALKKKELMQSFLRSQSESVDSYIKSSHMTENGIWATEFEIMCTAYLLKSDIFTFSNGKWLKYSAAQVTEEVDILPSAIYLNHENQCHYNVVLCTMHDPVINNKETVKMCPIAKRRIGHTIHESHHTDNRKKTRYHTDPDYRERVKARCRAYQRKRYAMDSDYRQKQKDVVQCQARKKYQEDNEYSDKKKDVTKTRYKTDLHYKEGILQTSKEKYNKDEMFREYVKQKSKGKSKEKYKTDENFKEKAKQKSKNKYKTDEKFKKRAKQNKKDKYKMGGNFKEKAKCKSILKYKTDNKHRERLIDGIKKKYKFLMHQNPALRQIFAKKKLERRAYKRSKIIGMKNVISFKSKSSQGPVCTCVCCQRLFFENQVQIYKFDCYRRKGTHITQNAKSAISNRFVQNCSGEYKEECKGQNFWICKTCHRKLLKGDIPAESTMNSLELDNIPEELKILNSLEQHLIALHIPFMKVVALPKGGQKAVHGPVVCVPSNINKATCLPRGEDSDLILRVKLKRKLSYKGYYEYQFVNTSNVQTALTYLKQSHDEKTPLS